MLRLDLTTKLVLALVYFLFCCYIFQNVILASILAGLSVILLMYLLDEDFITTQDREIGIQVYETDFLQNTLFLDCYPDFYAYTGILFLSTIDEDISVSTLRLQNQFSILHGYSQLGSVYLLLYKVEITQPWSNISETKQEHILHQSKLHLDNFQRVLNEMIPGMKCRFLSIKELKSELDFGTSQQQLLNFDFITPSVPKNLQTQEIINSVQDPQKVQEITPNLASK